MTHNAVVVGGNRTPFAKAGGPFAEASNHDLLTAALDACGLDAGTGRGDGSSRLRHVTVDACQHSVGLLQTGDTLRIDAVQPAVGLRDQPPEDDQRLATSGNDVETFRGWSVLAFVHGYAP